MPDSGSDYEERRISLSSIIASSGTVSLCRQVEEDQRMGVVKCIQELTKENAKIEQEILEHQDQLCQALHLLQQVYKATVNLEYALQLSIRKSEAIEKQLLDQWKKGPSAWI